MKAIANESLLFEGKQPVGYVPMASKLLNLYAQHMIVRNIGDCMNSDLSPIRIKNNDRLVIHAIQKTECDIVSNINKVIVIMFNNGDMYTKQLVCYDNDCIVVKLFNPCESLWRIPVSEIKSLFVVDCTLSPEYIKQNTYKPYENGIFPYYKDMIYVQ